MQTADSGDAAIEQERTDKFAEPAANFSFHKSKIGPKISHTQFRLTANPWNIYIYICLFTGDNLWKTGKDMRLIYDHSKSEQSFKSTTVERMKAFVEVRIYLEYNPVTHIYPDHRQNEGADILGLTPGY